MKIIKPETSGRPEEALAQYPTIYFNSKDLPELKDWEVGKTYEMKIRIKQISMLEEKEHISGSFNIIGIEVLNKGLNSEQKRIKKIMNNEKEEHEY